MFLDMPNTLRVPQPRNLPDLIGKSFFRGKAIPIKDMHINTLRAHKRDVLFRAQNREQLKGAKITYKKHPTATRNGRPILAGVDVEGPNVTHYGARGILGRRASARGFNHDAAYYRGTSSPETRYLKEPPKMTGRNTRTGKKLP
jgi:hypothetical protein